jgi:hypothetical protein
MGNPTTPNPYWSKAIQYQQKSQVKPQQQQSKQEGKPRRGGRSDFGDEWADKDVDVDVVKGTNVVVLRGKVVEVAKYWIKMIVDGGVVYVNKAAIVTIKPRQ